MCIDLTELQPFSTVSEYTRRLSCFACLYQVEVAKESFGHSSRSASTFDLHEHSPALRRLGEQYAAARFDIMKSLDTCDIVDT